MGRLPSDLQDAISNGHSSTALWMTENGWTPNRSHFVAAAQVGNIQIMNTCFNSGIPLSPSLVRQSTASLHPEAATWLINHGVNFHGCLANGAVSFGNLDYLKWLKEHGCVFDQEAYSIAAFDNKSEICEWLEAEGFASAPNPEIQGVISATITLDDLPDQILMDRAHEGDVECIKTATKKKLAIDEKFVCYKLAKLGDLEGLKLVRSMGFEWSSRTCAAAANMGHIHVLHWVVKNGCPLSLSVFVHAARAYTEILEYLKNAGCPWGVEVTKAASRSTNPDYFWWLVENGCPYSEDVVREVTLRN